MTLPLYCLLGYAAWALLLVGILAVHRLRLIVRGERPLATFSRAPPPVASLEWRMCRAHLNACENLPIFGAVVLVGALTHATAPALGWLAAAVVAARIVQSLAHLFFDSTAGSALRATAFFSQQFLTLGMLVETLRSAG